MRAFDGVANLLIAALGLGAAAALAYAQFQWWRGGRLDVTYGLVGFAALVYVAPTWVAISRRHRDRLAIAALNLLLGATGIGWIAALVWSLTSNVETRTV